jgi:phosphatidyl-myo-inositol alpha-mannosyltransferase
VSEDARDMARRALGGEYELLHNGIEVERFSKVTGWPTTGPTVFFVGRHEPRKGLAVLLDAIPLLAPSVRVWIGGDGPETEALRARAGDDPRVEWLGRLGDEELARRLRGADVFCAPSLHGESFGVVLLEAMAAQTPIVASDLPGYRNVARAGQDALLVPPGDAPALAGAINRVLEQASLAESLAASGEGRAAEHSMDRLAERYLDLYAEAGSLTSGR